MANHSSSKKSIRQTEARTKINKSRLSAVRTIIKKTKAAIEGKDKAQATSLFVQAQSQIMKAVTKNIIKLNTASRTVKRLASKLKEIA